MLAKNFDKWVSPVNRISLMLVEDAFYQYLSLELNSLSRKASLAWPSSALWDVTREFVQSFLLIITHLTTKFPLSRTGSSDISSRNSAADFETVTSVHETTWFALL